MKEKTVEAKRNYLNSIAKGDQLNVVEKRDKLNVFTKNGPAEYPFKKGLVDCL